MLILVWSHQLLGGEVALTFDDAPRPSGYALDYRERVKRIRAALKHAGVPAAFFVLTKRMQGDEGRTVIDDYLKDGHFVSNHTASHPSLERVGADDFIREIQQAHDVLAKLAGFRPWFRFPELKEGRTQEEHDKVSAALKAMRYLPGYATVDSRDAYMELAYQQVLASGVKLDESQIKQSYLNVVGKRLEYFDDLGKKVFLRPVKQVLLMHENDLAGQYLGDLITALKATGWTFVSPEIAYQDPMAVVSTMSLDATQGRLATIAKDKNIPVSPPFEDPSLLKVMFGSKKK